MAKPPKPKKKSNVGGARKGAGRKKRETVPITIRLHPLTIQMMGYPRNRSSLIELAILDEMIAERRKVCHEWFTKKHSPWVTKEWVAKYEAELAKLEPLRESIMKR